MDKINELIDTMKDDIVKATQGIVSIKSVMDEPKPGMPFGQGIHDALEYALNLSENLGFRTVNVDGYMGYAEYGEGKEMIGVLGHLDVVPEGDGWKYPPYGGEIHDGKIYARGTLDDKGPIIAALYGLKAIKEASLSLSKRVRIFFGTDEEHGSSEVHYYLERDEAPTAGFTPDAEYPIIYAEKGILTFKLVKDFEKRDNENIEIKYIKGGNVSNMVPDYCEAYLIFESDKDKKLVMNKLAEFVRETGYDVTYEDKGDHLLIKSKGASAHGSMPHLGKNAIMQMLVFLKTIDINGDAKEYIDFFATNVGMEVNGETFGVYLKDDIGDLSFNVGVIEINEKGASMTLNLRYPVTFKTSDVMDKLHKKLEATGIEVKDLMTADPLYFPKEHLLIQKLQKVYEEQTGLEPTLLAIGGGTYAKEMPNIVAFGPIFPGKPDLDHQANEYIEIDDLIMNAKIYGNAIFELVK